jgi:tRNA-binding protein
VVPRFSKEDRLCMFQKFWGVQRRFLVFGAIARYKEGAHMPTYDDFAKLDIRVGVIEEVLDFPQARKPAYKLRIDFGDEIGMKWSSAQVVQHYTKEQLKGMKVLDVVNFPPKQIGSFISESLTLGVPDELGQCILIAPSQPGAKVGGKLN